MQHLNTKFMLQICVFEIKLSNTVDIEAFIETSFIFVARNLKPYIDFINMKSLNLR